MPPFDQDAEDARKFQRQETVNRAVLAAEAVIYKAGGISGDAMRSLTAELAIVLTVAVAINTGVSNMVDNFQTPAIGRAREAIRIVILQHPEDNDVIRDWLLSEVMKKYVEKLSFESDTLMHNHDRNHPAGAE
jgi:hypothetical protein